MRYDLRLVSCCRNCGHTVVRSKLQTIMFMILYDIVVIFSLCGLIAITFVGYSHFGFDDLSGYLINAKYDNANAENKDFLRGYALNATKDCDTDEIDCFAAAIFKDLSGKFKYAYSSRFDVGGFYDSRTTIAYGRGDCDNMAASYCGLMKSVGFGCWVAVSVEKAHAVSVLEKMDGDICVKYAVDLTVPGAYRMACDDDPFSYLDGLSVSDSAYQMGW